MLFEGGDLGMFTDSFKCLIFVDTFTETLTFINLLLWFSLDE